MKYRNLIVYGVSCLCIPVMLSAEGRKEHDGGRDAAAWKQEMFADLDLTAVQKEQLRELRGDKNEKEKQMLKLRLERLELNDLIKSPSAEDEVVRAQAKKVSNLMAEMNLQRVDKMLRLKKILSPEQFRKISEKMHEHFEDTRKKWGQQGGKGGLPGKFGRGRGKSAPAYGGEE